MASRTEQFTLWPGFGSVKIVHEPCGEEKGLVRGVKVPAVLQWMMRHRCTIELDRKDELETLDIDCE